MWKGRVGVAMVSSLVGLGDWLETVRGESRKVDWVHAFYIGPQNLLH